MQLSTGLKSLQDKIKIFKIRQFQSYYHLKKDLLAFRHCYITMSIERPIIKKKLRYLQKNLRTHFVKRDCSLPCLNGRCFITSRNFVI